VYNQNIPGMSGFILCPASTPLHHGAALVYAKNPAPVWMRGSLFLLFAQWLPLGARSSNTAPVVTEQSLQSGMITISCDRLLLLFIVALQKLVENSSKIAVDKMIVCGNIQMVGNCIAYERLRT